MAGDQTDDKLTREALQDVIGAVRSLVDGKATEARRSLDDADAKADRINRKKTRPEGYVSPLDPDAEPDADGVVS